MKKIMFISHGHPEISKGGGEIAAWNLYEACKQAGNEAIFVARVDGAAHGGASFSIRNSDEILLHSSITNWFTLTNDNVEQIFTDLSEFVNHYNPDVIHVHHYIQIGVELFPALKRAAPKAKLFFTLHEYMAICQNNGQMVKPESLQLCFKSSPADCNRCFPDISPADFFLKQRFLLDQFSYVDQFISPSEFLKQRYVEWGLESDKIEVIENVLPNFTPLPPRTIEAGEKRNRLAYFGQINLFKGLDVLLKALLLLPVETQRSIHLEINGINLDLQPKEYQEKVKSLLEECGAMVTVQGAYESHQLPALLSNCDWVVMPSIWWENSPVVIQESIALGRPLIGADIGGMKEKIENVAGLTFSARSPSSLATTIQRAVEVECFDKWHSTLSASYSIEKHLALIDQEPRLK